MAYETLQAIVGTALVDSGFRSGLLKQSWDVLSEFELTPEECEAIHSIRANDLTEFAQELNSWISRNQAVSLPRMG
jgi:hypothetical protein